MSEHTLDAKGLKCPLPVLKAAKLMKGLAPGDTLAVEATDPSAPEDFRNYAETSGNELSELSEGDGLYRIVLKKAG